MASSDTNIPRLALRPQDRTHPGPHAGTPIPGPRVPARYLPAANYPFLVNLTALRASHAARESLNIDILSDAFDDAPPDDDAHDAHVHDGFLCDRDDTQDTNKILPTESGDPAGDANGDAQFAVQMRARLADLGDRALETREIAAHHAALRDLIDSAPTSSQFREWVHATSSAIRRARRAVDIDQPPDSSIGDGDRSNGNERDGQCSGCDRRDRATERDETNNKGIYTSASNADMLQLCDALDTSASATVSRLADACKPMEEKLAENYKWIRSQSTMLGIHGCTHARCPVCLVQPVTTFIDPCGHTFCEACSARTGDDTCCICRGSIRAKRKLFWCG